MDVSEYVRPASAPPLSLRPRYHDEFRHAPPSPGALQWNDVGTTATGKTAPPFSKTGEREKATTTAYPPPIRSIDHPPDTTTASRLHWESRRRSPTRNDCRRFTNEKWNAAMVALFLPFDFSLVIAPCGGKDGGACRLVCRRSFVV